MGIAVHRLADSGRRMLLELLASERAGEDGLPIGTLFDRDAIAADLCAHGLAHRTDDDKLWFTPWGRRVAEMQAERIVRRSIGVRLAC